MLTAKYLGNRRGDKIGPSVLIEKWTHYAIAREGRYSCWTAVSLVKKRLLSVFERNEREVIVQNRSSSFFINIATGYRLCNGSRRSDLCQKVVPTFQSRLPNRKLVADRRFELYISRTERATSCANFLSEKHLSRTFNLQYTCMMTVLVFQGPLFYCFSPFFLKDDRFVTVRSKENVEKVETSQRSYMELRSMSRRSPPYTHNEQRFMNSQNACTTKKQNGLSKIKVEEEDNSPTVMVRDVCVFPKCKYFIYSVSGLLICFLCIVWISLVFPYPMHASCIVKWKFEDPCKYVMQKFRSQILNWSSCVNCGPRGGRCLYTLKEPKLSESNIIKAVHLAPNLKTTETIKIDFDEINKTCVATGESVSNEWFRIFDYGTNYCNLHNLVTEIGFDKKSKFLELTTNAVCTQYNMAVCD